MAVTIRKIAAIGFFLLFLAASLDIAQLIPSEVKKDIFLLQLLPSILQLLKTPLWFAGIVLAIIFVTTLLTGRLYCSTICPLGLMQDAVAWLRKLGKKRHRYREQANHQVLRYGVVFLVITAFIAGTTLPISFLDPFSLSGKIVLAFIQPVIIILNNGVSSGLAAMGNYAVIPHDLKIHNFTSYILTTIITGIIVYTAFTQGRWFCNALCPVGGLLGLLSKKALFKIKIDEAACKGCGVCERVCKAGCIDTPNHRIDYERCVVCFNCIEVCPSGVILQTNKNEFAKPHKKSQKTVSRKSFLGFGALALLQVTNKPKKNLSGESTLPIMRTIPVTPPGSIGFKKFTESCTACQICTGACPSFVLQPSIVDYGLAGLMQPVLNFNYGYCNFECTLCTELCPTGALLPLTTEQKKVSQLGKVRFVIENCIVETKGTECGACSEHCPTKAVTMIPYNKLRLPKIKEEICIGCGACEYACPVKPYKAIFVEGNRLHGMAEKAASGDQKSKEEIPEEFPF